MSEFSEDRLLGGRILLRQPLEGYRVAIDPILLAAAVPLSAGQTAFEIGVGSGAAALCLAARVPDARIVGIERDRAMAHLAMDNVAANDLMGRVDVMVGELAQLPARLVPGSFHQAMMNPPYLATAGAQRSPSAAKNAAHIEGDTELADWIKCAHLMLRPKGGLTAIHRADRLADLVAACAGRFGEIQIFPLWPHRGRPASRILLRARKSVAGPLRLLPGLVLHEPDGRYSAAAEALLREGRALDFEAAGGTS